MKRIIIISAAAMLATFSATSCRFIKIDESKFDSEGITIQSGNGSKGTIKGSNKETRLEFNDFDKIVLLSIDGSTDITIRQSEATEMTLELPENLEEYLKVEYAASACKIYLDKDYKYTNAKFDIVLGTSDLEKLVINGAAEVEMEKMELGDLKFEINGAGNVDVNHVKCGDFSIEINGAGEVDAQDMDCGDIDVEINGAGEIDLGGKCKDVTVEVNGTGSVDISRLENSGRQTVRKSGIVTVKK